MRALARRNLVLSRMLELGKISQQEYDTAVREPVVSRYHGTETNLSAPYLAEMVRSFMVEQYGEDSYTKGFNVYTTVSAKRQQAAQEAVFKGLIDYDLRHGYRGAEKRLWQAKEPRWSDEAIFDYLVEQPSYDPFEPAVVIRVRERQADVLLKGGLEGTINWDGMKWARPFISDSRQGTSPRRATDILSPGQQIWVWPVDDNQLRLAQLPDVNAAFIALNPQDGAIEALVGGVITSYSIHYTKLYDQSQPNDRRHAEHRSGLGGIPFFQHFFA